MRLYHPDAYDWTRSPQSYWAATCPPMPDLPVLQGDTRADVVVVGAGYAGLNAALELAEQGADVVVLDGARPGWGASGRNGGFCCLGGAILSPEAMDRRFGKGAGAAWTGYERAAIARVEDNLVRYGIDADRAGAGEVCLAHSARALSKMDGPLTPAQLQARGLSAAGFHGGQFRPEGFGLHPLKYTRGLVRAALAAGVRIFAHSPVEGLDPGQGVRVPAGRVTAPRILIATNGYSNERLPGWLGGRILPVLSAILVTRPLTQAEVQAQGWTSPVMAYDSRRVVHYFRLLPDGRMLFGGRGGTDARSAAIADFHRPLRADFEAMFPAFAGAETTHYWAGLVCMMGGLAPYVGPVPGAQGLFAALGWHGNGVAAASEGGRRVAALMLGCAADLPPAMAAPPPRLPLAGLRRHYLGLSVGLAGLLDRLG
jgi:glycine/D-amino acid oxidase-like deaminating enzyme